jgi:hypothetical protein
MLANLLAMNHFQFMVLAHGLDFFLSIRLGGFKILIVSISCELKRLCVINLIDLYCFIKIIILLNSWKCITWDKLDPPTWVCQWCVTICWRWILQIKAIEFLQGVASIWNLSHNFFFHSINYFFFITCLPCL